MYTYIYIYHKAIRKAFRKDIHNAFRNAIRKAFRKSIGRRRKAPLAPQAARSRGEVLETRTGLRSDELNQLN